MRLFPAFACLAGSGVCLVGCGHSGANTVDATGGADSAARDGQPADSQDQRHDAGLEDAAFAGTDFVWFASDNQPLLEFDGTHVVTTSSPANTYNAVWGSAVNDVFALAWNGAIVHFDGTSWQASRTADPGTLTTFSSLFGFSASDVWGLGSEGTILRYDGTAWTKTTNGAPHNWANSLWGASSTDMWAIGYSPNIHHWDGAHWQNPPGLLGIYMFATWGASTSDIWAVGQTLNQGATPNTSTIAHYDGTGWALWPMPTDLNQHGQVFNAVWGTSASNVWAVGSAGLVAHWDGTTWSRVDIGTTRDLTTIGGSSPASVWVAGVQGTILHRDATGTWSQVASGTARSIYNLWVGQGQIVE
jgi:hypothetical protein